jgi:hypothetical protein
MSDLRGRNAPAGVSLGSTGRIIGAAIVAIVVCGVGAYTYETGVWTPHHPKQVVADNRLPSPTPAQ